MISRYLTFGVLLTAMTVQAQTKDQSAVKPELLNHIYFVGDSNQLTSLEKNKAAMVTKMKLAGFGGSSSSYSVDGNSSSMRLNKSQPEFALKMSDMMDPSNYIRLYKFKTKGKEREATISGVGAMGTKPKIDGEGISFVVKSPATGVYILVPEKPLEAGEYGFINMMMTSQSGKNISYTVFAFGIDR